MPRVEEHEMLAPHLALALALPTSVLPTGSGSSELRDLHHLV